MPRGGISNQTVERDYQVVETTYKVPDVSCEHCVAAINQEVGGLDGVEKVDIDLEAKTVTVRHNESVSDEQIVAGLDEAGFDIAA